MNLTEDHRLRERTGAIMLAWAEDRRPPFTGETTDGYADAIAAAHVVADEARLGLHRWIDAARRAGLSWTDIGGALGTTKQAAQQRFRMSGPADDVTAADGEQVVRIGATAFNEMAILRDEGRRGSELIRTGALILVFRRTDRAWDHRRRIGVQPITAQLAKEGWIHVSSWFPFHYLKRPAAPL